MKFEKLNFFFFKFNLHFEASDFILDLDLPHNFEIYSMCFLVDIKKGLFNPLVKMASYGDEAFKDETLRCIGQLIVRLVNFWLLYFFLLIYIGTKRIDLSQKTYVRWKGIAGYYCEILSETKWLWFLNKKLFRHVNDRLFDHLSPKRLSINN